LFLKKDEFPRTLGLLGGEGGWAGKNGSRGGELQKEWKRVRKRSHKKWGRKVFHEKMRIEMASD